MTRAHGLWPGHNQQQDSLNNDGALERKMKKRAHSTADVKSIAPFFFNFRRSKAVKSLKASYFC